MRFQVSRRTLIDLAMGALVVWIVVFWRLGYLSLLDPDEAHYAELTREMIRSQSWLVPLRDGVPFIDKPVLYHWFQAAAQWALGETEFALRLPSACAAVGLLGIVAWAGRALGHREAARNATLMVATTPLTFVLASVGVFDMVYTAFLFGAVACLIVAAATDRGRVEGCGWVLLALAVMVKGPVAGVLVLLFLCALRVNPGTRSLARGLHWVRGASFVALVAAPWFVYMAWVYRAQFLHDYVLAGNLWYLTRPAVFSTRNSDAWFYARTYFGAGFPWSLLACAGGIDAVVSRRALGAAEQALWLWIAVVIAFFSIAGFKLDTYVFPAIPATGLIAALAWERSAQVHRTTAARVAIALAGGVLAVGGAVLAATMFRIDLGLAWSAIVMPIVFVVGGLTVIVRLQQGGHSASVSPLIAVLLAAYALVVLIGFPVLERSRPTASIGRWVNRHTPPDEPIGVYGLDDWRASLRFYSRRPLIGLQTPTEVTRFLGQGGGRYVLMLRSDARGFRANGFPLRRLGGRPAIVGRSGKFIRKQVWGRIVVTTADTSLLLADADNEPEIDLPDN